MKKRTGWLLMERLMEYDDAPSDPYPVGVYLDEQIAKDELDAWKKANPRSRVYLRTIEVYGESK